MQMREIKVLLYKKRMEQSPEQLLQRQWLSHRRVVAGTLTSISKRETEEGFNGTRAIDDLLEDVKGAMAKSAVSKEDIEKIPVGWIYFWRDGFLRCFSKQKDNSVWILSNTS